MYTHFTTDHGGYWSACNSHYPYFSSAVQLSEGLPKNWIEELVEIIHDHHYRYEIILEILQHRVTQPEFIEYLKRCIVRPQIITAPSNISTLMFNPNGKTLAVASLDGFIFVYNQKWELIRTINTNGYSISITYKITGDELAAANFINNEIYIIDMRRDKSVEPRTLHLPDPMGRVISYCPAMDQSSLLAVATGNGVSIINTETLQVVKNLQGASVNHLCFSRDGKYLIVKSAEGRYIRVYDTKSWDYKEKQAAGDSLSNNTVEGLFATGSQRRIGTRWQNEVGLWDIESLQKRKTILSKSNSSLEFSRDGSLLVGASGSEDDSDGIIINIWDTTDVETLWNMQIPGWYGHVSINPTGENVVVGSVSTNKIYNWKLYSSQKALLQDISRNALFFWIVMNASNPPTPMNPKDIDKTIAEEYKRKYGEEIPVGFSLLELFKQLKPETQELVKRCF